MKYIIIYDFDGTLTPYSMPKFEILEKCGLQHGASNPKFLEMAQANKRENIDLYVSIYKVYLQIIKDANFPLTDESFCLGADQITYNNGVDEFLKFLNDNNIENYLISSGLKVYLEKTRVANFFKEIYASTFLYNSNGEVTDIQYLMSDKNKVKAIKDIIKKIGNEEDDCHNIIYVGDGLTDYYAMEYVKRNGGTTIFVYQDKNNSDLKHLEEKNLISFSSYADFSLCSELVDYIKKLVLK